MALADKFHVQRHDPLDVRLCSASGYPDWSTYFRYRSRFCQDATQEEPGSQNITCKIVALLRRSLHQVSRQDFGCINGADIALEQVVLKVYRLLLSLSLMAMKGIGKTWFRISQSTCNSCTRCISSSFVPWWRWERRICSLFIATFACYGLLSASSTRSCSVLRLRHPANLVTNYLRVQN